MHREDLEDDFIDLGEISVETKGPGGEEEPDSDFFRFNPAAVNAD